MCFRIPNPARYTTCRAIASIPSPFTPLEEFPSSKAVPHHCGPSLLGVHTQSHDAAPQKQCTSNPNGKPLSPSVNPEPTEAGSVEILSCIDEAPTPFAESPHVAECPYRSTDTDPRFITRLQKQESTAPCLHADTMGENQIKPQPPKYRRLAPRAELRFYRSRIPPTDVGRRHECR